MSETLFPTIDKQFLTAKQIEEIVKLKKGTLRQIVNRNKEISILPYSEIRTIKGKETRVYYDIIIDWLKKYFLRNVPLNLPGTSVTVTGVTDKSVQNVQNKNNPFDKLPSGSQINALLKLYPKEALIVRIDKTMGWEGLPFVQTKQAIDTPKPIDKPKTKDKPLTRRQALHSLIIHYADAKGMTYNRMYSALYTEYFGYSGYYELSRQYKNLMDYIEDNNQLDNFAEFVRSKLSE